MSLIKQQFLEIGEISLGSLPPVLLEEDKPQQNKNLAGGLFKDASAGEDKVMPMRQVENEYVLKILFYSCNREPKRRC